MGFMWQLTLIITYSVSNVLRLRFICTETCDVNEQPSLSAVDAGIDSVGSEH